MPNALLIGVVLTALIFEFINGFHDTANAIATTVYTRALTPRVAILASAAMNFLGALTHEGVAMTIAHGLVNVSLDLSVILAALIGAIMWDLLTWWLSIPSSSSHALIGSLIGATIIYTGTTEHVMWDGVLEKVVIPLFTSPLIGLVLGFFLMKVVFELFANWTCHHTTTLFHQLQIVSSLFMAFSHGSNDAQKTMGIITMALIGVGMLPGGAGVPLWAKVFCATTMALGTAIGGRRIMKTVGSGVTRLEPVMGFVSQTSSAIAIQVMTALAAPVSTTQVVTTAVMGSGAAKGFKKVHWGLAKSIVRAWFVTLPATMLLGAAVAFIVLYA